MAEPMTPQRLRQRIILALCDDHGHLDREGSLACRTCNRRADKLLPIIEADLARERQRIDAALAVCDRWDHGESQFSEHHKWIEVREALTGNGQDTP